LEHELALVKYSSMESAGDERYSLLIVFNFAAISL
jgi:hypothetical protein